MSKCLSFRIGTSSTRAKTEPMRLSTNVAHDRPWGLRRWVLPPLIAAICVLQGTFLFTTSQKQQQELETTKQATARYVQDLFQAKLENDRRMMTTALEVIIRDPVLMQAFQARDRATLLSRAKPIFNQFRQQSRITHWYFHQRDRVNFLRVHKKKHSDLIDRITLKRAEHTQQPSIGLEQGIIGAPVLRAVYPWYSGSPIPTDHDLAGNPAQHKLPPNLIGYVELGIEFQDIASQVSKILDVHLVVLVDKKHLDRPKWEAQIIKQGKPLTWDQFPSHVVVEQTLSTLPEAIHQVIPATSQANLTQKQFSENGKTQQVIVLPLQDLDGKNLGYIAAFKDISNTVNSLHQSIFQISMVVSAIGIGLILFFVAFLRQVELTLMRRTVELTQAKLEKQNIQRNQSQLIQTEKMSSLGQLVAGVAHEINNPVSFIYSNLKPAQNYMDDLLNLVQLYQQQYPDPVPAIETKIDEIDLEFLKQDFPKLLSSMQLGADRIKQIVLSLRNFSRVDEAAYKAVDLHVGIDSTLVLLENRLKAVGNRPAIQIIKNYGDLPLVECYASQINQVLMNILVNAIDVLEEPFVCDEAALINSDELKNHKQPVIKISTETRDDHVTIRIADNGPGIPEAVQKRLFDPFFTTKPVGKGTGMGLSISYQIITENHGGTLTCVSTPDNGAEFVIQIPIQQTKSQKLG
ncbi:ATP-binding protein [Leptothermofonsia sp. ETS-13]|uniref:ATP-binding protein n=1 Tax=Leptothermofonsia sp. ETS-13 TaxID=3035696 RepID=UPI003BA1E0BF